MEEELEVDNTEPAQESRPAGGSSGRTSGGQPAPPTANSSNTSKKSSQKGRPKSKITSFRDLQGDAGDHDDDSDKEQEYFAGGDKSALAVQDPGNANRDPIQRLIDTARRYANDGSSKLSY